MLNHRNGPKLRDELGRDKIILLFEEIVNFEPDNSIWTILFKGRLISVVSGLYNNLSLPQLPSIEWLFRDFYDFTKSGEYIEKYPEDFDITLIYVDIFHKRLKNEKL